MCCCMSLLVLEDLDGGSPGPGLMAGGDKSVSAPGRVR